ncbi:MAG: type II/IV secretion system protein [Deltaproteobacteria bacterium]|nr:type II/IV secretion system protein [Deltaproteobacteria bacterium]
MADAPRSLVEQLTTHMVEMGLLTKDQLAVAEVTARTLGGDLGHILIKKGFVSEHQVRDVVKGQLALEELSLAEYPIDPAVVKAVPFSVAQRYHFMPLFRVEEVMTIAISDPLALFAIGELRGILNCEVRPVLVSEEEVLSAIQLHYQSGDHHHIREAQIQIMHQAPEEGSAKSEELKKMASGSRVVSAINSIIGRACRERASDIHIEPQEEETKVRYRLDGLLEERMVFPKGLHLSIVSRLKVMSGMDIAERRVPQDGRVRLKVRGTMVDLRLSTYPTMFGEKVVMRLLMKEAALTLEQLGLQAEEKQRFSELITLPYGIFLVTGPTGSGKTSTLYAALSRVNSQERNIVSIEDPVENEIPGVNQAQVNVKAGMTFAAALRSILRQDPDVIMVGEIRDRETADMAVRAALTGHLVFSTLHTNTAAGAIERLADMGVEPFLVGSALLGVMAQRLVRRICSDCREEVTPNEMLRETMARIGYAGPLFRGKGCAACRMSGYRGRIGLFELMVVDDQMRRMVTEGKTGDAVRRHVREQGVRDMRGDGCEKIRQGITTLEEVLRVTQDGS